MAPLRATLALLLGAAAVHGGGAGAQDGFDDPNAPGDVPCIVLNRYEVKPLTPAGSGARYRGEAVIENICGRAMEVHFCFLRTESVDGNDRSCFQGALRPWALASIEDNEAPARITSPEYQWRFLRR